MPFVQAKCPICGGMLAVDDSKKAAICQFCGDAFIVEEAVNNYITYNVTNNNVDNSVTHNYSEGTVVNVYEDKSKDFVIAGGVLRKYKGASVDVVIPDGVIEIGEGCFEDLKIKSVTIPDTVETIGEEAFKYCEKLEAVYITNLVAWCDIDFAKGASPLYYADNLYVNGKLVKDVIIPDGVTKIPKGAFYGCISLTSIKIPDSVTKIEAGAFDWCKSLESINIDENNSDYSSVDGVLFNKEQSILFKYPEGKANTEYTIPDSVKTIRANAFCNCNNLTSVIIGDKVEIIDNKAFSGCEKLVSVTMPDSILGVLYEGVFKDTPFYEKFKSLKEKAREFRIENGVLKAYNGAYEDVVIPDGVTKIVDRCFKGDYIIKSVTIPASVKSIGESAFDTCNNIKAVYITDLVSWCNIDFANFYSNPLSYHGELYVNKVLASNITIPDGVKNIGNYAFCRCSSLKTVTLSDSVTSIGNRAFKNCENLTSVTIPDSVTSIGGGTFSGCTRLTSITIPTSVTNIGEWAFCDCKSLTSVTIPDSVTNIGLGAFSTFWKSKNLSYCCGGKIKKGVFANKCSKCGQQLFK